MASTPVNTGTKVERLSFAKVCRNAAPHLLPHVSSEAESVLQIAAAGIKPPSAPLSQQSNPVPIQKHTTTSSRHEGTNGGGPVSPPQPKIPVAQPRKLLQLAAENVRGFVEGESATPKVHVQDPELASSSRRSGDPASSGLLAPVMDDTGTQVSASSGSAKPSSLDGKSVASGTTFALDEKESLRPDDSASLKAVDDEDVFSASNAESDGPPVHNEEGTRAFTDQLREIDSMEPPRGCMTPQRMIPGMTASHGVLYVPPQGPGIGHVPVLRDEAGNTGDSPPDPKLLEALESPRDRIWVLKLEQDIFDFVKDTKENSLDLPQCNAYHRMLAHKIADYYTLGHFVDDSASAVRLFKTPNLRIPPPLTGITTPSTAASTPPPAAPQMKILRRGDGGDGSRNAFNTNSENSESGNEDDKSKPATREEREAKYAAARLRIMGASQSTDVTEAPKEKDESRSSSATGRRTKKKQRSDSEDGFEARSAFVHYAPSYGANAYAATPYGYPGYSETTTVNPSLTATYTNHDDASAFKRFPQQALSHVAWTGQGFPLSNQPQQWPQVTQSAYDLSSDFHRSMSLQNQNTPTRTATQPTNASAAYGNQYHAGVQPSWQQQSFSIPQQTQQAYGYPQYSHIRPTSSGYGQEPLGYQFGQLPSQTCPGRPSNSLEHPLPGSYKSRHFDPQSQSFVPAGGPPFRSYTPQGAPISAYNPGGTYPSPVQRQGSSQSQTSSLNSSHVGGGVSVSHQPAPNSMAYPGLVHPLPQPVFRRQPSPSLPLPPKPSSGSQRSSSPFQQQSTQAPPGVHVPSSIAKWGQPASLPAKPPPPVEPFDPSRHSQVQRQPSYGTAAAARMPGGAGTPSFAPPILANGSGLPVVVNGSNQNAKGV